jgi:AcrR family transcriptional regulator
MSPAPARTSRDAILAAARSLLEEEGLDAVTMAAVATRVGVRAPSLYKHLRDRTELVSGVIAVAAAELTEELALSSAVADPPARVRAIASSYRAFARRNPRAAALMFADLGPDLPIPQAELARSARPVLEVATALAGDDHALPAARALTAFVHGFTSMESAGAFRLGGDVDAAFGLGIDALIRGLGSTTPMHRDADFAGDP